ncbi:hypothetical protein O7635_09425 [Asanoa sp. WMMD1127]|uniref:hypothetical protein n=1 Tax=Asanoa sp. WMMD1127 TaxID=3016107 RepID=UPI002417CA4A|nr:hypothetical protein [Asanoa sp. WMMD1127]MDG4822072.1 hypothetical protein [Asanoa sp. WMMD1127]
MDEQHLDDLFGQFRAGPPLVVPAGAGAARQAFRHRRRVRVAASCVLAAVAVGVPSVGFATGAFDGTPKPPVMTTAPTPTPTRSTTPPTSPPASPPATGSPEPTRTTTAPVEPTSVPRAAMLREADLPAGYEYRGEDLSDADWTLAFLASICDPRPRDTEPRGVTQRDAVFGRDRDEPLFQRVYRMATPAAARSWLDGLPDRLGDECGGSGERRFTVVDTDFAGADAVLIRTDLGEGEPTFSLFVRQGPLLTQIWQKHETDVGALRDLGRAAADRLCQGTTAC